MVTSTELLVGFCLLGIGVGIYGAAKDASKKRQESNTSIYMTVIEDKYHAFVGEEQRTANTSGSGVTFPLNGDASKMGFAVVGGSTKYSVPAFNSQYLIKGKTVDGRELVVSVFDSDDVKKESLDMLISPGTKINFPRGNVDTPNETYFSSETRVGSKRADRIRIL